MNPVRRTTMKIHENDFHFANMTRSELLKSYIHYKSRMRDIRGDETTYIYRKLQTIRYLLSNRNYS